MQGSRFSGELTKQYIAKGTGSEVPANTSLYDSGTYRFMPEIGTEQAAPVQNTWYTILNTTANCRLNSVAFSVGGADETIETRITIDGQVLTSTGTVCAHDTGYYIYKTLGNSGLSVGTTAYLACMYAPLEGRSVKVEIRKTSANGAGSFYLRGSYGVR